MTLHPLDMMKPKDKAGKLWHDHASGMGGDLHYLWAAVPLAEVRTSLAILFRALGGAAGIALGVAPEQVVQHRRKLQGCVATQQDKTAIASFDGNRLSLPPVMDCFGDPALNRAAYFWLTALAAMVDREATPLPMPDLDPQEFDAAQIALNATASDAVYSRCPGLQKSYTRMAHLCAAMRPAQTLPIAQAAIECAIRNQLDEVCNITPSMQAARAYTPFQPVPIWVRFAAPTAGKAATEATDSAPNAMDHSEGQHDIESSHLASTRPAVARLTRAARYLPAADTGELT